MAEITPGMRVEMGKALEDARKKGKILVEFCEEKGWDPPLAARSLIDAAGTIAELMALSAELRMEGVDSPLSLGVIPDLGDSSRYAVYLMQSGLTLPDRDYYLEDDADLEEVYNTDPIPIDDGFVSELGPLIARLSDCRFSTVKLVFGSDEHADLTR